MSVPKKTVSFLLAAFMFIGYQQEASAVKIFKSVNSQRKGNGSLKSCALPGLLSLVNDGVIYTCYTSGTYDIELEDECGNIMFRGTIVTTAGQSYYICIPGVNPQEDELYCFFT